MAIEYSKLSNKINGLFAALDTLTGSGKADGVLSDAEMMALDDDVDLSFLRKQESSDIFKDTPSILERNLLECIDRLVHKPEKLQMPLAPGDPLVQSGNYTYRPQSAVAIDATSHSAEWFVKTSGTVAHPNGIEIPFGLVEVSEANAYVRGTVRYAKFDIVLESDSPMKTDGQGITQVLGEVTIRTPFGNFSAQCKGSFQVIVSEQNEAPLLVVQGQPIEVTSTENPKNHFRIRQGGSALFDANHYAFLGKSEWDLGDTLTGIPEDDISKTASRFQTEAQTGFSFGEWDAAHIRPDDRTVYRKDQNMIEWLNSNRIKLTADKELTAAFVNPANDSFLVHGDGRIVIRQIIIRDVPKKENNPQRIDWFSLAGDGQAPNTQTDYGFSEVTFNEPSADLSAEQRLFFGTSCLPKMAPQIEDKQFQESSIFGWRDADRKDPLWGYFLEMEGTTRLRGLWNDSFHPAPLNGVPIIFGRHASYTGQDELSDGSLSVFESQNRGRHFWIPGYHSDLQIGEKNFDLAAYHQGATVETLIPAQDKQATIAHGKRPQSIFEFLLNDAACKEDWERANQMAKLSDNQNLMKGLAETYSSSTHFSDNLEQRIKTKRGFVDLAIHYFARFHERMADDESLTHSLETRTSLIQHIENSVPIKSLIYDTPDEVIDAMMKMGVSKKWMVYFLSKWSLYDEALSFANGNADMEATILIQKSENASTDDEMKKISRQAVVALKRALEEDKKTGQHPGTHLMYLRETSLDLEEWDEALQYSEGWQIGAVYERKGNYDRALQEYEKHDRLFEGAQLLSRQYRYDEALDWYLKSVETDNNSAFPDDSPEDFQKKMKKDYENALSMVNRPEDQREAARAKLCESVARKAAEMGIDVFLLAPDCKTE